MSLSAMGFKSGHELAGVAALLLAFAVGIVAGVSPAFAGEQAINGAAPLPSSSAHGSKKLLRVRDPVPDQYIVLFAENALPSLQGPPGQAGRAGLDRVALGQEAEAFGRALGRSYGAEVRKSFSKAVLGMAVSMEPSEAAELARDPGVVLVEEVGVIRTALSQPSPIWNLDRIDQRALPLDQRYRYANRASSVTAYVIDTGIRLTHHEFQGRARWGVNTSGDTQDIDCHGHGTHVAGTLGGLTYGVAKGVGLVAIKALNCSGSGTTATVIDGIEWMIEHVQLPAVANMSLGGGYSEALNQAVARATEAGILVAVAAGNAGADACGFSPASAPKAVTVGAVSGSDVRASFSNFGSCVDLFAPGVDIRSAHKNSDTTTTSWNGTSMAAPHVAGALAIYLHQNPNAGPETAKDALLEAAAGEVVSVQMNHSQDPLLFAGEAWGLDPRLDTTADGWVDEEDVFEVKKVVLGASHTGRADLNNDGLIDVRDLLLIIKGIQGLF